MACGGTCKATTSNEVETRIIHSDSDDVWGSDEETDYSNNDIKRSHHNLGYVDGISHAKVVGLQNGFDAAFPIGAALGIRVGKILSLVHLQSTELFKQAEDELNITKVLHKDFFDDELNLKEAHGVLEKWEAIAYGH